MNRLTQSISKKGFLLFLATLMVFILAGGGVFAAQYYGSPENIRTPAFEHYHMRLQVVANGEQVDFSDEAFQEPYDPTACTVDLTESPIHFHDSKDQFMHIHWDGVTGGQVLKYYGWNFIGGNDDSLGMRYDTGLLSPKKVPVFADALPNLNQDVNYYVYVGDENSYEQKNWDGFINENLEDFMGTESILKQKQQTWLGTFLAWAFPVAAAHGGEDDGHSDTTTDKSVEELTRINNLLGNVVIFAQDSEPTENEITERFNNLVPLTESTCGG